MSGYRVFRYTGMGGLGISFPVVAVLLTSVFICSLDSIAVHGVLNAPEHDTSLRFRIQVLKSGLLSTALVLCIDTLGGCFLNKESQAFSLNSVLTVIAHSLDPQK